MSKFTSGKWFEDGDCVFTFDDVDNQSFMIADVNGENRKELEANARLIAAAPEMYNWIEKTCRLLHDLKRYAHDEDEMRTHAKDLNATYNNLLNDAYLMLVRIDKEGDLQ